MSRASSTAESRILRARSEGLLVRLVGVSLGGELLGLDAGLVEVNAQVFEDIGCDARAVLEETK